MSYSPTLKRASVFYVLSLMLTGSGLLIAYDCL